MRKLNRPRLYKNNDNNINKVKTVNPMELDDQDPTYESSTYTGSSYQSAPSRGQAIVYLICGKKLDWEILVTWSLFAFPSLACSKIRQCQAPQLPIVYWIVKSFSIAVTFLWIIFNLHLSYKSLQRRQILPSFFFDLVKENSFATVYVKSVNINPQLVEDHFDTTVKMSTYLVAFIVSDFKSISKITSHGVQISVYVVPDKIDQAEYALDAAVKLLDFYEDYFSIPYPLPKQDLAAIPDFQSGAMENWGLTTYRESVLLYDPGKSSASSKLWITMIIAHELAHQEDYFLRRCFDAMEVDALNSSHPISTPVEDPAQILEMFDDVSYEKGSCILNMLRNYLTADVFKAGLVQYLQKYSYQNTKNEDLWNSMTNHWTKGEILDVRAMMDTWTLQTGFPLVTVTVRGKNVHLQQERYLKGVDAPSSTGYLWQIPLTYITSKSNTVQRFLMTTKAEEVEWIKFNVDMNGYYIVHYEDDGWDRLINLLRENHTAISSNDRASLINNVFQLVSINKLSISKALDLTLYLKHERQIMPVLQGMSELIPIYRLMERRDMNGTEKQLKQYIISLFKDLIDAQSWSDEGSVSERYLRDSLLLFACMHRYQPCVDKATGYFTEWQKSNGTLRLMDQGLRGDIIRTQDLPFIIVLISKNPSGYHLAWTFLKENWEKFVEKFELGSNSIAAIVTGVTSRYSTRSQLAQITERYDKLSEAKKLPMLKNKDTEMQYRHHATEIPIGGFLHTSS
ncbi:endoplasmic reticulum aminopeptidase 1 [Limosa lapponica baueri]|uniref:Aminopeptidase n=1 Tax=Limosa lapponica baueri TaxID=1758121 RepID=A0A2I0TVV5_LIMLA|nr:endoplasmic reticulum aminopeptidase 1 [Limosa lapponica baueri]